MTLTLMCSAPALGATWWVDASNPNPGDGSPGNPFQTIAAGISAAAATGDEIIVRAGAYYEYQLDLAGKAVDLHSEDGPEATIIDAIGGSPAIYFDSGEDRDTIVEGFTITGADSAAIWCSGTSPTLRDNIITGNSTATDGGGVYINGGSPLIEKCVLSFNYAMGNGGALYCVDAEPQILHCELRNNTGELAGGAAYFTFAEPADVLIPEILWSEITCNSTGGPGGALYINQGNDLFPLITHTKLVNNHAMQGGGIYTEYIAPIGEDWIVCYDGAPPPDSDSIAGKIALDNCLLAKNFAQGSPDASFGGAIYANSGAQFRLTNCSFTMNKAAVRGGAIWSRHACVDLYNSILWMNDAPEGVEIYITNNGSQVYLNTTTLFGGVIMVGGEPDWHSHNVFMHQPVITAPPLFPGEDPFGEGCDYRLTHESQLIDLGGNGAVSSGVDLDGNARIDGEDPAVVDLGCYEYQLTRACPWIHNILAQSPATGLLDARQPHPYADNSEGVLQGIGDDDNVITINLDPPSDDAALLECWGLCESDTGGYTPNEVLGVTLSAPNTYEIELRRPITPGAVTYVEYRAKKGAVVLYRAHPANANADSEANSGDVLSLIDYLNQTQIPPAEPYSTDIDRSGVFDSFDVLRELDLLNGAGTYRAWNQTGKPTPGSCLYVQPDWCECSAGVSGGFGGEMMVQGLSIPVVELGLDDVFREYLATVDLSSAVEARAYPHLVDGFCYWIVETLPVAERQALACQLTDPSFVCLSERVQDALPQIAASIIE